MKVGFSFRYLFLVLLALILWLFWSTFALASCGSIIVHDDIYDPASPTQATLIEDCNNPFNADNPEPFTYTVVINEQQVTNGSVINVDSSELVNVSFDIDKGSNFSFTPFQIFKKEGQDYYSIPFIDSSPFGFDIDSLEVGEYVAVLTYEAPPVLSKTESTWMSWLKRIFLPNITHAFFPDYVEVVTFSFTVEHTIPTPIGASNVLFLPGIMGSRLYEESGECDIFGGEKERWVDTKDCEQLRLATNITGNSINDIYTKPGEESIVDTVLGANIYKSFLKELDNWKKDEMFEDYEAVPYDWRLGLDDILKSTLNETTGKITYHVGSSVEDGYLYQTLSELVDNSNTGKVTIVAHSNGGLVAKQLLDYLKIKNDPLVDKVDNLILVAVPQIGSVVDIVGILHGDDLAGGFVMKQEITRQLMNTMSFSHHLLPTQDYFDIVTTPAITFEEGESTSGWRSAFGNTISSSDKLHDFLRKESGRVKPAVGDLATPETVDGFLLNYADVISTTQSDWMPEENTKVYQIAGTGLLTPSNLTYFTDEECTVWDYDGHCLEYASKLGYRVQMAVDGDETVAVPSSLFMGEERTERWWLDLSKYNEDNINRKHNNIFEVEDISHFIANIIESTTTRPYTYLTNTSPDIPDTNRLVFQLHSPLNMSLTTPDGEISSSTNTISGATYRRYGELQYLSVPKNENEITLHLKGTATGSFTLDIEEIEDGIFLERYTYSAIPSATGTVATMEITDDTNIREAIINLDYDGNGEVDINYDTEGEIAEEITYNHLISFIEELGLNKWNKFILLKTAKTAKKLHNVEKNQKEKKTLKALKQITLWYQHYKLISIEESEELQSIVNSLIDKI